MIIDINKNNNNVNINNFFKFFSKKKQYIKKLKKQSFLLSEIKQTNYKLVNTNLLTKNQSTGLLTDHLIMFIIDITFTKANTFLHVMDASGRLKFFCSAGHFQHKGKNKRFRFNVFKSIYRILITKLRFLKGKPIALHLKNVGFNKFWIIKKLKAKFFIKIVKNFNLFPYNGCRKKKVKRKKN
jgi:ribosomal protein S11